jgi:hypothetical protein
VGLEAEDFLCFQIARYDGLLTGSKLVMPNYVKTNVSRDNSTVGWTTGVRLLTDSPPEKLKELPCEFRNLFSRMLTSGELGSHI